MHLPLLFSFRTSSRLLLTITNPTHTSLTQQVGNVILTNHTLYHDTTLLHLRKAG